jgi:hypothetical protein
MTEIRRFRRKPTPGDSESIAVVRYTPGMDLDVFHELANGAAVTGFACVEVEFPYPADWGGVKAHSEPVLLVRWVEVPDDHPPREEFRTVKPGKYLGVSPIVDLYVTDDRDLEHWYNEVTPAQDGPGPV